MKRMVGASWKMVAAAAILILLFSGCGPSNAQLPCDAAAFTVTKVADTNDGICSAADCSLREAVVRSNTCPGVQTIRIPAGTYNLTLAGAGEDAAATGDLDLTDSVHIQGVGIPVVIDGQHLDRVFEVFPAVSVDMTGLTIQHGQALSGGGILNSGILIVQDGTFLENSAVHPAGTSDFGNGGAILSQGDGSLQVVTSTFTSNSADQGGAIMVLASGVTSPNVQITYTTISQNSATFSGGGLWLDNGVHATLVRFEISGNTSADRGNGIYNASTLELTTGTIESNTGGIYGGGIYNEPAGNVTAREVLLQDNLTRFGGGIYNLGPSSFYLSAFVNNQAERGQGGAIFNSGADSALTLDNTTISGNSAPLGGGGIRNDGGNFRMMFVTMALNEADGINATGAGEMQIRNSILADNSLANCTGTPPGSIGNNIDTGNTCGFIEPSDLVNTAPLLEPLAMNGGLTPTHALGAGSPAIDSADPDRCDGTDQRGVSRPQGPNCDRGAYELESAAAGAAGSIRGLVWHDLCASPDGPLPLTPPPGCIRIGGADDGNGVLDPGEPGIAGVTVRLGAGSCPATGLAAAVTGSDGSFSFDGLAAGVYCVSVDSLETVNVPVLIPGGWTFPQRGANPVTAEITIGAGETRSGVNFGWDYQFLPAYIAPTPTPTAILTPTATPPALAFLAPWISTDHIYYYGTSCGTHEVQFQVGTSDPAQVFSMGIYFRLKNKGTGETTGWSQVFAMNPLGNGEYFYSLLSENIPDYSAYTESWLQYGFVANDQNGATLLHSDIFSNITLSACGKPPPTYK